MGPRQTRKIRQALLSKGFERSDSDHEHYILYEGERKTGVRTKLSHGVSEYGATLLGAMADQLKLGLPELEKLIDCPMTREELIDIERSRAKYF